MSLFSICLLATVAVGKDSFFAKFFDYDEAADKTYVVPPNLPKITIDHEWAQANMSDSSAWLAYESAVREPWNTFLVEA